MEQYNNPDESKPRIKLPLIKQDSNARLNDLERMIINQSVQLEKMRREIGRLKADIENLQKSR